MGSLYQAQGRYAEAEPLYKRSLAIQEKALDTDRPGVVQSLSNLGLLYHAQGRYADAEPLYKRALTIQEKALGTKILGVIPGDQAFRPLAEGGCPLVARWPPR